MKNIKRANFEDICCAYYYKQNAQVIAKLIYEEISSAKHLSNIQPCCQELIQSVIDIHGKEFYTPIQSLLSFYSILEMAEIANFIPEQIEETIQKEAVAILCQKKILKLYTKQNKQSLLILFLERLKGKNNFTENDHERSQQIFLEFLEIDMAFTKNKYIKSFLSLFNDEPTKDMLFNRAISTVKNQPEFINIILDNEEDSFAQLLTGIDQFFKFCHKLHSLLERSYCCPMLQSSIWHYYGFLFDKLGPDISHKTGLLIEQFRNWNNKNTNESGDEETSRYITETNYIIKILASPKFSITINRALHPDRMLWKLLTQDVDEIMLIDDIPCVSKDTQTHAALLQLDQKNYGALFIVDTTNYLEGVVTDGDVRRSVVRKSLELTAPISKIMIPSPRRIYAGEKAADAIDLMEEYSITVLPVVEKEDKVVGLIHIHDLLGRGLIPYKYYKDSSFAHA